MNLNELTIKQARDGLSNRQFSCQELTKACLDKIRSIDDKLKAFITVSQASALDSARRIDKSIAQGRTGGYLFGVPVAIKDVLMTKGVRTTAASKILDKYIATYDATAVHKLKEQGAVLVGKNNCDEFAMGASTENSAYGPTYNPWDLTRVPGGSSGGSAVSVAVDEAIYALGTDTGGSVRQPAAFCGVVGLKPTYGRVSRYGLIAMASSLDCVGSFTKNVADAALVLAAIAGADSHDATTQARHGFSADNVFTNNLKGLKIGLPQEYFVSGLDAQIDKLIKQRVNELVKQGAEVMEVSLPSLVYALAVYYILVPAEVSSNLAKFDGLRYGSRPPVKSADLLEYYMSTRGAGFGPEARRRILIGTYVLSAGYVNEYYLKAQKVRTKIIEDFNKAFEKVDVLISPTTPTTAFRIGEKIDDPVSMYLADIYTGAVNLAGLPAVSVPAGLVDDLPVGLQVIGKPWDEATILNVAFWVEKLRGDWPKPKV